MEIKKRIFWKSAWKQIKEEKLLWIILILCIVAYIIVAIRLDISASNFPDYVFTFAGIMLSIFASYIFYILNVFIPNVKKSMYNNKEIYSRLYICQIYLKSIGLIIGNEFIIADENEFKKLDKHLFPVVTEQLKKIQRIINDLQREFKDYIDLSEYKYSIEALNNEPGIEHLYDIYSDFNELIKDHLNKLEAYKADYDDEE